MALNKSSLESAIKTALKNHNDSVNDAGIKKPSADDQLAADLADAIYEFILSAQVQVYPGIAVSTSGGPGSTVAPGEGILQ